ncbi:type VI secretion system lipoprotein TssJ [Photobacterium aquae]|nr:type VI secretion system lipoprotein TssJ [Photobacterium aquae]
MFVVVSIILSGCTVANYVVSPYTSVKFEITEDVNPDLNGRASPVVVKVFSLSSRTLFDNQDFFSIYDDPNKVLGPDLIETNEFEFLPGSNYQYEINLTPGIRYAGILVAYRDIENARWREVIEIDMTDYKTYDLVIGELAVFVDNP